MQTLNYKLLVQLLLIFQSIMFISAFFHIFSFKGFVTLTGQGKRLTYLKI